MLKNKEVQIEKGKKTILWLIDSLGHGGAENLMPKILGAINKAEFDQRVCVLQVRNENPVAKDLEAIGIPVDFVPVPKLRNLLNLPRLLKYLRRVKPDVVHTQLEFAGTLGCLASRMLGIPNVTTFHLLHNPEDDDDAHWRYELMWASFRHFADLIIAVSDSVRNNIIDVGRLPDEKVVTLHNGIQINKFSSAAIKEGLTKVDLGIPEDAKVIITVAVLRKPKGIQYVLEALPDIAEEIPETHYLIVGDGDYREPLEEIAKSLDISDHVHFAGYQTSIPSLLALSDIFILPTLDDALPTVLMEATAAGKPLVASDVGGVPEILQNNINGILTTPGSPEDISQASIKLLKDKNLSNQFSSAGTEIARKSFDIDVQVSKLEQIYKELITNANR